MKFTTILTLLATGLATAGVGDSFAIEWSTIDGGGGKSSSATGEFSVSGTIAQPDARRATGGPFSVQGGFWARYGVVQNPGAPPLTIARLANGDLRVAWTLPATGWVLDESPSLGQPPTPWTEVPAATYQTDATHRFIIVPNPSGRRFYGLRRP